MNLLEVPLANTCLQSNRHDRFGEEVVAGTVAAVFVDGRRFDRQVGEAGFRIDRDLRPHPDVARPLPRSFFPGVVAEFTRLRNRVELPDLFAGADIERAHETFRVRAVAIAEAFEHRRADDHHVVDDGGCRVQADFTLLEIDLFVFADDDADLQVDDAVLTERRDWLAGLRIELDETIAGGDVDDAFVVSAVGPV